MANHMVFVIGPGSGCPVSFDLLPHKAVIPDPFHRHPFILVSILDPPCPFCSWPHAFWAKGNGVDTKVGVLQGVDVDAAMLPVFQIFILNNLSRVNVTVSILDAASCVFTVTMKDSHIRPFIWKMSLQRASSSQHAVKRIISKSLPETSLMLAIA